MSDERTGILHVEKGKLVIVEDGTGEQRKVKSKYVDQDLLPDGGDELTLTGTRVSYEWRKGQAQDICREPTDEEVAAADALPSEHPSAQKRVKVHTNRFNNPYAMIPAPPRRDGGPLGDEAPPGQHRLEAERWSGRIRLSLTTRTPLLLMDHPNRRPDPTTPGHDFYGVTRDIDGRARLAPTAFKGMLRSAYETVTNSRFGVFAGHDKPLSFRMAANEGLRMVPFRVCDTGDKLQLLCGSSQLGSQSKKGNNEPLYAAWLPAYGTVQRNVAGQTPGHGERVVATVEFVRHARPDFRLWRVCAIAATEEELARLPSRDAYRGGKYEPTGERRTIEGWACVTNQNISRKHDERVFFTDEPAERELTDNLRRSWEHVVASYTAAHSKDEIHGRRKDGRTAAADEYLGSEPGQTAWSRHLINPPTSLAPGTLGYARLDQSNNKITGLYPVMISRDVFGAAPDDVLDPGHRPATARHELSPADRVFGWVNDTKGANAADASSRGNLRVVSTRCLDEDAIEVLPEPLTLAILGEPKPQQGRFYVHQRDGETIKTLDQKRPKDSWFTPSGERALGRKMFWHHAGLHGDHWAPDVTSDSIDMRVGNHFREYRRAGNVRDNQNRSITEWIKPATTFEIELEVTNLSKVELGALLWLAKLPDGHFHRLGYGKPLGFGSVRLKTTSAEAVEVVDGRAWGEYFADLTTSEPAPKPQSGVAADAVEHFEKAVADGGAFEATQHIAAFLAVTAGNPTLRVHYPRVRGDDQPTNEPVPPDEEAKSYEWFVANERPTGDDPGTALPLPGSENEGLPIHNANPPPRNQHYHGRS